LYILFAITTYNLNQIIILLDFIKYIKVNNLSIDFLLLLLYKYEHCIDIYVICSKKKLVGPWVTRLLIDYYIIFKQERGPSKTMQYWGWQQCMTLHRIMSTSGLANENMDFMPHHQNGTIGLYLICSPNISRHDHKLTLSFINYFTLRFNLCS
jgi:hypothetical protein